MASSTAFDPRPGGPKFNADLQDVAQQVREEFADRLDADQVDECLDRVAAKFDDAKVRSFVPLLVRRYVRDELYERLARLDQHPDAWHVRAQVGLKAGQGEH